MFTLEISRFRRKSSLDHGLSIGHILDCTLITKFEVVAFAMTTTAVTVATKNVATATTFGTISKVTFFGAVTAKQVPATAWTFVLACEFENSETMAVKGQNYIFIK